MMNRVVAVIDDDDEGKLRSMRLEDMAVAIGSTWTDHYLLQATVPFRGNGALIMYVGHPDLTEGKPLNREAMTLLRYLQDVCMILPSREIRGRAIICSENGNMSTETLSLIQRIIGTKKERQLPPEVDEWIKERENRNIDNFPPALKEMHRLLLPRRERYGMIDFTPTPTSSEDTVQHYSI